MGSLVPGTRYKVGVYAVKDALKSNPTVTEFTTGRDAPPPGHIYSCVMSLIFKLLHLQMWTLLGI